MASFAPIHDKTISVKRWRNAKHHFSMVKRGTFAKNDQSLKCKTKTINTEEGDSVSQRREVKTRTQPPRPHIVERAHSGGVRGIELGVVGKSKGSVVYRWPSALARRSSSSGCKSWAFYA
jgi:hypothetical protein